MLLCKIQAQIDRRVLINAVDINGKFKIDAVSNDILKIQKVDGSTLYDAFELSFNNVDKTSILRINNVDIISSLNLKALASNAYDNYEIGVYYYHKLIICEVTYTTS